MKMKFLICFMLLAVAGFAQRPAKELFDAGIEEAGRENYKEAIKKFSEVVDNHAPDSLYPLALYNVAYLYVLDENYVQAIPAYEKILDSDLKEDDLIGGGIMDSPYANYKYKASRDLSQIYITQQNYEKALEYHIMSDVKYPFLHFCGNEGCSNETSLALRYAFLYDKLGQPDRATQKLLEYALKNSRGIQEELSRRLSTVENVRKNFDSALKNVEAEKAEGYENYYITFLGAKIYIGWGDKANPFDKAQTIRDIKETDFYKMIEQL